MELNADFSQRVVIHSTDLDWQLSPIPGVERRMLDRIGDEKARATSIVRYAPGSQFSAHVHGGGEEFLVLAGVFQDEHGDFPAGSYIRNPPTSKHTPGSAPGCMILVKLWQFDLSDRTHIRIDTHKLPAIRPEGRSGIAVKPLFADGQEQVQLEIWQPHTIGEIDAAGGLEIFVMAGGLVTGEDELRQYSWLRLPVQSRLRAIAGPAGCTVWLKTGHLAHPQLLTAPPGSCRIRAPTSFCSRTEIA
ncbi:MAG: cupin [Cyanothece sp. SIO1E1]|nr:cupin [Cyanothece sp. SIO1E1]